MGEDQGNTLSFYRGFTYLLLDRKGVGLEKRRLWLVNHLVGLGRSLLGQGGFLNLQHLLNKEKLKGLTG